MPGMHSGLRTQAMRQSQFNQDQCKETMRSTAVLNAGILQMAETMYSCVMLALKLLKAFCPEAGPHQFSQIGLGWPSPAVLKALQVSSFFCTQTCRFHIDQLVQLVVLAFVWLWQTIWLACAT